MSTVGSTGVCPTCGRWANPAVRLYAELANDQATWVDTWFWLVVGGLVGAVLDGLVTQVWGWVR